MTSVDELHDMFAELRGLLVKKDVERDLIWSAVASRIEDELGGPLLPELSAEASLILTGKDFGKLATKDAKGNTVLIEMDDKTKVNIFLTQSILPLTTRVYQRALLDAILIRIRQCCEVIRDVIVKHTLVDIGWCSNEPRYAFSTFTPFYTLFKTTMISKLGRDATYKLTKDDYKELDNKLRAYFVNRLGRIRRQMESRGNFSPAWNRILTADFFNWIFDMNNALRARGNRVAHSTPKADVLHSLDQFISNASAQASRDVPILRDMRNVYSDAVDIMAKTEFS